MPTTAKGYRYPASSAAPNVPVDIQNLAQDVNDKAMPVFPDAKIHAYRNTGQAIPSDLTVPATIILNATSGTPSSFTINTSTGVITVGASAGGEYTMSGAVSIAEVGPSRVFATVYVNGAERLRGLDIINRGAQNGDIVGSVVSGPLTLAGGDQVTLRALHTGSAATVAAGLVATWIQMRRES